MIGIIRSLAAVLLLHVTTCLLSLIVTRSCTWHSFTAADKGLLGEQKFDLVSATSHSHARPLPPTPRTFWRQAACAMQHVLIIATCCCCLCGRRSRGDHLRVPGSAAWCSSAIRSACHFAPRHQCRCLLRHARPTPATVPAQPHGHGRQGGACAAVLGLACDWPGSRCVQVSCSV